jgi:hypothetical protein
MCIYNCWQQAKKKPMLNKNILDFNENLIGLRDFVELIDPILNDKFEEHNQHVQPLVMSAMIKESLESEKDWEDGEKEKMLRFQEIIEKNIAEKYSEKPELYIEKKEGINDEDSKRFSIKIKSPDTEISNHIDNVKKTKNHIELLYKNSLISALSSVEWFFSQLLHFYYDKHPESAGIQKKTLTLSDLKDFGSIQDAEKYLVDTKIDDIIRGNFESWIALLKSDLNLNLGYLNPMIKDLVEIYQRRNLFVHNGGIVNSIYLSKVDKEFKKDLINGSKLIIDKEYLDKAILKLQKAFILVGAELWKKLSPEDTTRCEILGDIIYENLLHNRWEICEGLCYFSIKDSLANPIDKVLAQINYWLCKKELNEYSSIEKEINKADFSDKKEIFQLGLFSIRGEIEKAIELLPIVLETEQTNIKRLEEFPILKELRETDEYKKFKENSKFFKEENKDIKTLETVEK